METHEKSPPVADFGNISRRLSSVARAMDAVLVCESEPSPDRSGNLNILAVVSILSIFKRSLSRCRDAIHTESGIAE